MAWFGRVGLALAGKASWGEVWQGSVRSVLAGAVRLGKVRCVQTGCGMAGRAR